MGATPLLGDRKYVPFHITGEVSHGPCIDSSPYSISGPSSVQRPHTHMQEFGITFLLLLVYSSWGVNTEGNVRSLQFPQGIFITCCILLKSADSSSSNRNESSISASCSVNVDKDKDTYAVQLDVSQC